MFFFNLSNNSSCISNSWKTMWPLTTFAIKNSHLFCLGVLKLDFVIQSTFCLDTLKYITFAKEKIVVVVNILTTHRRRPTSGRCQDIHQYIMRNCPCHQFYSIRQVYLTSMSCTSLLTLMMPLANPPLTGHVAGR